MLCVRVTVLEAGRRGNAGEETHECEHQKTTAPTPLQLHTHTDTFIGGIASLARVADAGITHVVVSVLFCVCVWLGGDQ